MFIDTEEVTSTWVKESPAITTREDLNKDTAREEWKKLIAQDQLRKEEDWTKKKAWATNP